MNTYRANSLLYYIKTFPIIGKLIPSTVYSNSVMKQVVLVISIFIEVMGTFLGKIIYVSFLVLLANTVQGNLEALGIHTPRHMVFFHIFFFLTIAGGWINCYVLEMKKDNYYTIMLMKMDARNVAVSKLIYFLIRAYIGNTAVLLVVGMLLQIPMLVCFLLPVYIVAIKIIGAAIKLWCYSKKKVLKNFQKMAFAECAQSLLVFLPAFGLLYLELGITYIGFYIAVLISAVLGIFCLRYVIRFPEYRRIYRRIMAESEIVVNTKTVQQNMNKEALGKQIDTVDDTVVEKDGYAYFNEIFIRRHRKMLAKTVKIIVIIELIVLLIIIGACQYSNGVREGINQILVTLLPTFLFVMYILNRGNYVTKAMFINCDCQMLHFRFYRQPKAILGLFKERLKSIIIMDLSHSMVIAIGLPLILFISGGTDVPIEYFLLFVSIVAMSVFFSVHSLVLYYVLQPYNEEVEMKNPIFSIINGVTYVICYMLISEQSPILIFGTVLSCFCITYIIVALILAYRLAPKTFRLR